MKVPWKILVVSSELESRESTATILSLLGLDPVCASTIGQCREILAKQNIGLAFCDRQLSDGTYRDLLTLASYGPCSGRIRAVLSANVTNPDEYREAKRLGIYEVIAAPCHPIIVEWMIIQARRDHRAMPDNAKAIRSESRLELPNASPEAVKI
jgi:DNA-binding NtrC family response regulator